MKFSEDPLGIFTTDQELIIRSWDGALEQLTAIPGKTVIGHPLSAVIPNLDERGLRSRFERVLADGTVEVLAPAFHHYLIPCAPVTPSKRFEQMQQRVNIAPLREGVTIVGVIVTIADVTSRLDRERDLADQLVSPDETERLRAAEALSAGEAVETQPSLVRALADDSWRVRQVAVAGLSRKADADTVASLLSLLRDEHHNLSILNSALQVLAMSDVDIIAPLAEFLGSDDPDLRVQAALALGEHRGPRAIPHLIIALDDPDANVRYHAIEALGKLRAAEAVDRLLSIAESGDFFLAFPAVDALVRIGHRPAAARLAPLLADDLLRTTIADALGHLGDEDVVPPLVALLNQPDSPAAACSQALAELFRRYQGSYHEGSFIADLARASISELGTRQLIASLEHAMGDQVRDIALVLGWLDGSEVEESLARLIADPVARNEVIEALVRFGPRVTTLLLEQLKADSVEARQAAVTALGRIGDRRAVPALIEIARSDRRLTIEALGALAKIGDSRAFESLFEAVGDPDSGVRQAAVAAINSLGHPDTPSRARELLLQPDPHVRESGVKIAGYFGFRECIDLLIERCSDTDEDVRRTAIEHLPFLDDARALSVLEDALRHGQAPVRAAAARAFEHMDDSSGIRTLTLALTDPDSWVRYFAARSIGRRRDEEGPDALLPLLDDPATHVRIAALDSLGNLGQERAINAIAPLTESSDDDIAHAALRALGNIRHLDSLPPIRHSLRSSHPPRRLAAIHALASHGDRGVEEALQWAAAADQDVEVANGAIAALAGLTSPTAVAALIELTTERNLRDSAVRALAQLPARLVDDVARGLLHSNEDVRRATTEALGRMKDATASVWLLKALDDAAPAVRMTAVTFVSRSGGRDAEQSLVRVARSDRDPSVRQAAEKSLRKSSF